MMMQNHSLSLASNVLSRSCGPKHIALLMSCHATVIPKAKLKVRGSRRVLRSTGQMLTFC